MYNICYCYYNEFRRMDQFIPCLNPGCNREFPIERMDPMNITITGRKVSIRDSFRQRTEKKLQKLDRFFSQDADALVTATMEKDHFTVEITIHSQGMIFRAEKSADQMIDALEAATDVITRQIVKNKSRLAERYKSNASYEMFGVDEPEAEEYAVVKTKRFDVKPMDPEEAVLQMNLMGHSFFMFRNMQTAEINVVYRRNDGHYGLLEPSGE